MCIYQFAGVTKVGRITFFMLLTVNYTELKPHMLELAHIIAKDLDVNSSQVHQYKLLICSDLIWNIIAKFY